MCVRDSENAVLVRGVDAGQPILCDFGQQERTADVCEVKTLAARLLPSVDGRRIMLLYGFVRIPPLTREAKESA